MPTLDVLNDREIIADLSGYHGQIGKAAVRALKRAATSGRAEVASSVASDLGVKVGMVKDAMPIRLQGDELAASFGAKLKRLPLYYFSPNPKHPTSKGKGRGVSYKLRGGRERIRDAFIARMQSGHEGIYKRVGESKKSAGAWSKNLPIAELFGPSYGHIVGKYRPAALQRMGAAFESYFEHEVERLGIVRVTGA